MVVVEMPVVDQGKCNRCGLCISVCTCNALKLTENAVIIVETEKCGWCTECEAVCPTGAIACPFEIVIEQSRD